MGQQIKGWVVQLCLWDAQGTLVQNSSPKRPLVEHKTNIKGGWQGFLDLLQLVAMPKPWPVRTV